MASDNRIIDLTIKTNTSRFAQRSFSSVLVASVSNLLPQNVFSVNSMLEMPEATKDTDIYKAVEIAFEQDRPLGYVNVGKIIPNKTSLTLGNTPYSVKVNGEVVEGNAKNNFVSALTAKLGEGFEVTENEHNRHRRRI